MIQITGNILDTTKGIICHQTNCQGVMGSGLALHIKRKWPEVYKQYKKCYNNGSAVLGTTIIVHAEPNICVANLCAQEFYGRIPGTVYTDYDALNSCLKSLVEWQKKYFPDRIIYIPYRMSCGLAGGEWRMVSNIIEEHIPKAVIIKLGTIAKGR